MTPELRSSDGWRTVIHPPAPGAWNMAVDETLLRSCAEGAGPAVLRLYRWSPAALSIGAHQDAGQAASRDWLAAEGLDLVRRPTGGRAVLHDRELTYSVAAPRTGGWGGITEVYCRIARGLEAGLRNLGIEADLVKGRARPAPREGLHPCFTSPARYEILWDGRKLVGSAQRQVDGAFLQHGSIPFVANEEEVRRATGNEALPGGWMAGLDEAAGRDLGFEEVAEALVAGFEEVFGGPGTESGLSVEESRRADRLTREKYATEAWTLEGRLTGDERRRGEVAEG